MEFFAARKADISIVEMMDQIGRDLDPVTKNDTKCMMKSHDVHQLTKTALLEVKADSFLVKGSEGEYELPIGDSQRARRIIDGTMEGRNILYHLTQRGYLD